MSAQKLITLLRNVYINACINSYLFGNRIPRYRSPLYNNLTFAGSRFTRKVFRDFSVFQQIPNSDFVFISSYTVDVVAEAGEVINIVTDIVHYTYSII